MANSNSSSTSKNGEPRQSTSNVNPFRVSHRTLTVLEWPEIQSFLWDESQTVYGRKCAETALPGVKPHVDDSRLDYFNQESADLQAQAILELRSLGLSQSMKLPVVDTPDLGNSLMRISRSAAISLSEFVDLVRFQKVAQGLKHFVNRLPAGNRHLEKLVGGVILAEDWSRRHFPLVDNQGQLVDSASQDLKALRGLSKELHAKIKNKLEDFLNNPRLAELMQDFYITVRDGRYVIPVKTNFRGRVPGIVHDVSNTEATLFIEPQEIVEWNNQLKVTEVEIENEIEKILAQIVVDSKAFVGAFEKNKEIIGLADYLNAASKWVEKLGDRVCLPKSTTRKTGTKPFLSEISLRDLYHPLLAMKREVVTNSFSIEGAFVLSGPNTGGKTVLLKSLGLALLMARSGLPIPAHDAQIPEDLTGIMADIGDDQNLAENLSTFSAHLKALQSMLTESEPGDLVLIDEIATGTSPEEGQPLAQAIIESFLDRQLRVFVTTHYGGLKQFAMVDERARIASMSFDRKTRKPTYEIQLDLPGDSSALDIAEQVGFPLEILNRARKLKGEESPDLGLALQKLEEARLKLTERENELRKRIENAEAREKTAQQKVLEFEAKIRENVSFEAREILKQIQVLKDELSLKVKNASLSEVAVKSRGLYENIKDVSDQVRSLTQGSHSLTPADPLTENELYPGLTVEVEGFGMGKIVEVPKDFSKGPRTSVAVKVGDLQVSVIFSKIRRPSQEKEKQFQAQMASLNANKERKLQSVVVQNAKPTSVTCDVRGKTFDEALRKVEVSINEIVRNEDTVVTVIHGHGSEKLKEGIRNYLRKERNDLAFRTGSWPGEGGDGVTVIERAK
jgi:DNA mismatch repair protein MutS2